MTQHEGMTPQWCTDDDKDAIANCSDDQKKSAECLARSALPQAINIAERRR